MLNRDPYNGRIVVSMSASNDQDWSDLNSCSSQALKKENYLELEKSRKKIFVERYVPPVESGIGEKRSTRHGVHRRVPVEDTPSERSDVDHLRVVFVHDYPMSPLEPIVFQPTPGVSPVVTSVSFAVEGT
jgi:hypothetical protein